MKSELREECINCNRKLRGAKEIDLCGYCLYELKLGRQQGKESRTKEIVEIINRIFAENECDDSAFNHGLRNAVNFLIQEINKPYAKSTDCVDGGKNGK